MSRIHDRLLTRHSIALSLRKKHDDAKHYFSTFTGVLQKLESTIVEHFGREKLEHWKAEEKDWTKKVIYVSEKKTLPNPYDLEVPNGTAVSSSLTYTEDSHHDSQIHESHRGRTDGAIC